MKRLTESDLKRLLTFSIGAPTSLDERDKRNGCYREGYVHVELRAYLSKEQRALLGCGERKSRNAYLRLGKRAYDADLREARREFEEDLQQQVSAAAARAGLLVQDSLRTFGEQARAYIDSREPIVSASTHDKHELSYIYCSALHDIPLGEVSVADIESCLIALPEVARKHREEIGRHYFLARDLESENSRQSKDAWKKKPYAASQALTRIFISAVFVDAIEREIVSRNPARSKVLTRRFPVPGPRIDPFLGEELAIVKQAIYELPDNWHRVFLWLLLSCGLRPQECYALQYRDITVDGPSPKIHIRRALTREGVSEVKAPASEREIPLDPVTAMVLRKWRDSVVSEAKLAGERFSSRWYVCSSHRAKPMGVGAILGPWRRLFKNNKILNEIGCRRPYELRHSFATEMLSQMVDIKTLSRLMGHSSAKLTLDTYAGYVHSNAPAAIARYADHIDSFIEGEAPWKADLACEEVRCEVV